MINVAGSSFKAFQLAATLPAELVDAAAAGNNDALREVMTMLIGQKPERQALFATVPSGSLRSCITFTVLQEDV